MDDDRVSLYPLALEDVLRALFRTPPVEDPHPQQPVHDERHRFAVFLLRHGHPISYVVQETGLSYAAVQTVKRQFKL